MAEASQGQRALPPVVELLWGRRGRGRRGPRPGLSVDAIVEAAVRVADAEGLEAISMARVAAELGFTTMSLYRYVASKDELLQLMYNNSARGAEDLVLEGDDWRAKIRHWAIVQRDILDVHPWITQLAMPAPPLAPNSLHFVERALAALDPTGLPAAEKLRAIGLITSFTLNEAKLANDARHAAKAAAAAAAASGSADSAADGAATWQPMTYEEMLRELVDEQTYPHLYRLARDARPETRQTEREGFLYGIDLILDGVQARIDRAAGDSGQPGA